MKKISSQRRYLENHRWSVFTDDMKYCYFCKKPISERHEIIYGANRWNSMKWGYVLPLCREHHNMFHSNQRLTLEWCIKCQQHFTDKYSYKEWMEIFYKDYKEILKQKYGG